MTSLKTKARRAGILYLLVLILAPLNLTISGRFLVSGDAAATASNITASPLLFRLNVFLGFVASIVFLLVALALYDLLKEVDRKIARTMLVLISMGISIGFVTNVLDFAPLALLSGAGFLSVFSKPELDALAYLFIRLNSDGVGIAIAFWGLWLYPLGLLVMRSGYFPKILGRLLIVGCVSYCVLSFTIIVFPENRNLVNQIVTPFYAIGEVALILWLAIKGAKDPTLEVQPSDQGRVRA